MEQKSSVGYYIFGGVFVIILVLIVVFLVGSGKKEERVNDLSSQLSSGTNLSLGKYQDKVCSFSFNYPKNWVKSDINLPLPQKPLSQVTFNEPTQKNSPPKNSILSYICYDAKKYSFEQFVAQNPLASGQIETMNIGGVAFQRMGNFVYATRNDKLYIFQMFFTKYDLKPQAGYEEIFLNIVKSVQF